MCVWRTAVLGLVLGTLALQVRAQPETAAPRLSAASLYNQGNAYARAGKPGLAVLNYERARLLAPDDADIAANLAVVRRSAHLATHAPTGIARLLLLANPNAYAWLGVGGLLLAGAGLVGLGGASPWRRIAPVAIGLGGAGLALTIANLVMWWPTLHSAVIITPDAPVRVAPVPMGDSLFALPEADLVRIEAEHEGFLLVRTSADRTGWVAAANLARIVP
jgi:hypothetical protein